MALVLYLAFPSRHALLFFVALYLFASITSTDAAHSSWYSSHARKSLEFGRKFARDPAPLKRQLDGRPLRNLIGAVVDSVGDVLDGVGDVVDCVGDVVDGAGDFVNAAADGMHIPLFSSTCF